MSNKPLFLEIIKTWPSYFDHFDEGLGTTYERFILHRYFQYLNDTYNIKSVLEVPGFGMTGVSGINSLWWAANGTTPVVVDDNADRIKLTKEVWDDIPLPVELQEIKDFNRLPFESGSFDLSWNFASLWFIRDLDVFLNELVRVTKKVIFICMPNNYGIGYQIRNLFFDSNQDGFYCENVKPAKFTSILKTLNWKVIKSGYFDIPLWPDIAMKKEEFVKKLGLGFILKKHDNEANNRERLCIIEYFNGIKPDMEKEILKYAFLEKAPFPIKQLWSHHRYFIFEKDI